MGSFSSDEILGTLRGILAAQFEVGDEAFRPGARLRADLDLDSLDLIVFAMEIGDALGVELDEDDLAGVETLAELAARLAARMADPG